MLVNIHHDNPREHRRLLVAGVAFLTTIALLLWLSIAIYDKKFTTVTMITIEADRAGLQLAKFGDVRRNGVLIGQVREVTQDGEQAVIRVALDPEAARQLPADVDVQILPTTLFGQKFISFITPDDPSMTPLAPDAVIPASRVETNVELSQVLADLFPLLRSVRPADLNLTLNALATALEGRGADLGETLEDLGTFLDAIEPSLPTLQEDLVALADVAETYDLAAPDLLRVLDNLTVTSRTVLEKRRQLDVFFTDLTGLATTTTRVLRDNESALIEMGEVGAPVLKLLATYSPQLPCLLKGSARYAPILARTFEGNEVKQYIELGSAQYEAYGPDDRPVYGEIGHGPWCSGLPRPPVPIGPQAFDDGTDIDDRPPRSDLPTVLPDLDELLPDLPGLSGLARPRPAPVWARQAEQAGFGVGMSSGYAGTAGEQQVLNAVLAERSGRDPASYGALGSLLYGPVVRDGGARR
jgi:phospholipid/cholesterol/gamma-HCH transport system substrate-binding protein